jgi:hypothetical protein
MASSPAFRHAAWGESLDYGSVRPMKTEYENKAF